MFAATFIIENIEDLQRLQQVRNLMQEVAYLANVKVTYKGKEQS